MKRVLKYNVPVDDAAHEVTVPYDSRFVHVACQHYSALEVQAWVEAPTPPTRQPDAADGEPPKDSAASGDLDPRLARRDPSPYTKPEGPTVPVKSGRTLTNQGIEYPMTTSNTEGHDLLVAALAQIEMHPETWNQSDWRCETGMCLAGWMGELSTEVQWVSADVAEQMLTTATGERHVGTWAANLLNLTGLEADCGLFDQGNTIEDLRVGVKAVLNGESVLDAIDRDRAERAS